MSKNLASRLSVIAPSATLAMAAKAARLRAEGNRVFSFSIGEPDFDTPSHIRKAASDAVEGGATHYTPVTGIPELKKAICDATERHRGFHAEPAQVVVSCGAKHALFNIALALYEKGDEVLVPAPYWVSYPEQVRIVGAEPIILPTTEAENFCVSPEAVQKALTPRTKAIILCTPSNPTGSAYTKEHLLALAEVFRKHDCWIVVDEIYGDLTYDGFKHHSLAAIAPDLRERIITVDGVSKTYAMTGWRIGWSIAPVALTKAIDVVQSQSTTNPAAVAQHAALAALTGPRDELDSMRRQFELRRNVMVEELRTLPGMKCRMPEGAFYAFPDVRGLYGISWKGKPITTDEDVAEWFLEAAHVATVAGTPFGAPGGIL